MLLRNALLFLSRRAALRRWVERSRLTRLPVRRFVAGETLQDGLRAARKLHNEGMLCSLDHLGENVHTSDEADASFDAAIESIERLRIENLQATVSIKLTQFGLDISRAGCAQRVLRLAEAARYAGASIEIDMESSRYVDRTLEIVSEVHAASGNVRAVIQAYLYRSEADIENLCRERIPIRLCKGAYLEPSEAAFPKKAAVDANYRRLMERLLNGGVEPALATHDARILTDALAIIKSGKSKADGEVEFQMLYGVRRDLQRRLVADGQRLRIYVPYGEAWYPYFMRRLAERPANLRFLLRSMLRS